MLQREKSQLKLLSITLKKPNGKIPIFQGSLMVKVRCAQTPFLKINCAFFLFETNFHKNYASYNSPIGGILKSVEQRYQNMYLFFKQVKFSGSYGTLKFLGENLKNRQICGLEKIKIFFQFQIVSKLQQIQIIRRCRWKARSMQLNLKKSLLKSTHI